jgi:eukaryotic-like serine/threonine-protein kinase
LLYELLTGRTPFETEELLKRGIDGLRRTLQEEEPQRPSAIVTTLQGLALTQVARSRHAEPLKLISLLRGDLDWIVIRTLEKDRSRRYETANGLAMDIQRYLDNEPVIACPPSRFYRLQKLVHRNKTTFAFGTTVVMVLICWVGTTTWLLHKEREARQQAVAAEQKQTHLRMQAEDRERITQAAFFVSQGKLEEADELISQITAVKPSLETESVLRALGVWHALKGHWTRAAERFNLLLEADQKDNSWAITEDLLKAGPILIERGDTKGYERFRLAAVARFTGGTDPIFAERTLKISLLTPADDQLMKSLEPFSELSVNSMEQAGKDPVMEAWRCISIALMAYRQNYTPTAKDWCRRCLAYGKDNPSRDATAHIIQAMSCYRLGEVEQARSELTQGRDLVTAKFAKGLDEGNGAIGFWYDWLFARILLREAETLIENSPSTGK